MSNQFAATKSLGILPFRFHQEKEARDANLGEGIADSLATRLYDVEGLEVRPPSSVRKFLSRTDDSFAVGKLLQVDYILEGYIFPAKERTRFTVQLLNIPDRSVLWAAQFDEKETEIFKLEDRITDRIVKAILPHLETHPPEPITDSVSVQDTGEVEEILPEEENLPASESETLELPAQKGVKWGANFRSPVVALLILTAILGGFLVWRWGFAEKNQPRNTPTPTLLVLPFQNAGAKPADNAIGAGLAETLTGSLGNVKKLFVLSANAGRSAARLGIPDPQIGREFNVEYLLRGSVQRAGENGDLQISAELVETRTGNVLWAETFQTSEDDMSRLQQQIVEAVLENLSIEISPSEKQKISKRQTSNGLAYEFYLVGRYHLASRSHEGLHKAIAAFSQALEKDSEFSLAYVGLADAHALENLYEIPAPADSYQKARSNVLQALKLDENLAEAHASLAYILFNDDRNSAEAEREFRRAIELNPSYATTHHWLAIMLSAAGRHDEALAEIQLAQKLDPKSAVINSAKGMINFYARRYGQAVTDCEKSLELDTGFVPAHKVIRWIYQASNNYAAARAAFQREKNFSGSGNAPGWMIIEAQVEAVGGDREKARALLEKGLADNFVRENPTAFAYETALAYAALENTEKALEWLEKAEAVNSNGINFIGVEPRFDKLRNDQRFKALVKKLPKP